MRSSSATGPALALLACSLFAARPTLAQTPEAASVPPTVSAFWRDVLEPGWARSQTLLRHGLRRLRDAEQLRLLGVLGGAARETRNEQRVLVDGAVQRFEQARLLAPGDAEASFVLAQALVARRALAATDEERLAIDQKIQQALGATRASDPTRDPLVVASELGIVHTRRHDFRAAVAEYERAVEVALTPSTAPYLNLAEVTMLAGDLELAIQRYELALGYAEDPDQRILALWGLAVALDRAGEPRAALDRATEAVLAGRSTEYGSLGILRSAGVFFEPPYELHYYEALGYEALAGLGGGQAQPLAAAQSWQRYLERGGDLSPWAALAHEHIRRLSEPRPLRRVAQ